MKPTLLVMAAGMGSRYGGVKQIDSVGLHDETLLDYAIFDALKSGFGKVVFVIRKDIEQDFRERLFNRIACNCNAKYVFQSKEMLLSPHQLQESVGRKKPWGTVHAVLCGREHIQEPFAVINADDYYGRSAYKTINTHLSTIPNNSVAHAMIGYTLENTMSKSGSVSRGICHVENNLLVSMKENTKIYYKNVNNTETIFSDLDGETKQLTGKEVVSMNLFGFSPAVFDYLDIYFKDFIHKQVLSEKAECLLPNAVGNIVNQGLGTVKCYPTTERWFGMTYPEDREIVKQEIAKKIEEGYYPEHLWK